ncbi:hemolymph trypsin inhibitor B-like [Photinus pyralis]|uniref:hemolymph trypsin inhibitor B-like n=1 Tax=Photinus pyralis TaxID=7054 RepID=UPI001266EDA0|nr:hemolymph trypsin inhibitor B-like [Photinus pyralis]
MAHFTIVAIALCSICVASFAENEEILESRSYICNLPPTSGFCRARLYRWVYSPVMKKCVNFDYGGCAGNENNFETFEECMSFCSGI